MHLAARRRLVSPLGTSRGRTREFEDFYRARNKRILTRAWRGHGGEAFLEVKSGKSTIAATADRYARVEWFGAFLIASSGASAAFHRPRSENSSHRVTLLMMVFWTTYLSNFNYIPSWLVASTKLVILRWHRHYSSSRLQLDKWITISTIMAIKREYYVRLIRSLPMSFQLRFVKVQWIIISSFMIKVKSNHLILLKLLRKLYILA